MNKLKVFSNDDFGEIRTIKQNGEILFFATDVCRALELEQVTNALRRLDDDEKALISIKGLTRGNNNVNVVNEYGLYNLVLSSRKPEAKAFKRWITHEVLPAIRKTGSYTASKRMTKAQREKLANATKAERRKTAELWFKFGDLVSTETAKAICAHYGTAELAGKEVLALPMASEKTYSAGEIGAILGISANKVGRLAKKYNLKTEQYGKLFYDKSKYSMREVETFRCYATAIEVFREYAKEC